MKKKTALILTLSTILALTACSSSKASGGMLHMATKPMTEQYILGYMMKDLVEQDTDLTVELTEGVGGGVSNIQPALEKGEFDFYPEYTGTGWNAVLKKDSLYDESMFDQLQAGYQALDLTWTGMIGFNNTYGLCVRNEIAEEYNRIMETQGHEEPTGQAKLTSGYNLPSKYVLHTVGPIIYGGLTRNDCELLASCYRSCLELADEKGLKSVAFCCISTGEFHFPNREAAKIAVDTVKDYLDSHNTHIQKVIFNVFKDIDKEIYTEILR